MKISNEFKIGLAGVAALAILYIGINFLKGVSTLRSECIYYVAFDNIKQIAVSSPVYADGYKVGVVHDIHFDYKHNGKVIVEIDVDNDLRIPKGSTAALESAMLGGSTMHLLLANNPVERYEVGDTIAGGDMPGLLTKAGDMLPQVEQILHHVDTLVVTLNTLAADSNLHTIMANVQQLTANLNQSSVALNQLLRDDTPRMLETFTTTGEHVTALTDKFQALELEKSIASLNETLASLNASVAKLNSKDNSMGLLLNDTTLYGNLNQTVNSANALLVDLKANPKRYVHFSVFGKK